MTTDDEPGDTEKNQSHIRANTRQPGPEGRSGGVWGVVPPPELLRLRGGCVSMLLCSVATARSFLLWMHSLVTSSSAFTSSAVLCLTDAPGSKLNT